MAAFRRIVLLLLLSAACAQAAEAAPAPAGPTLGVKQGDVWVTVGDSITAQRLHTNYIEAYYRTRYPALGLQFRNSGIGGNRTSHVLARFDYDVAAWKPTIVSIELGMNDVNAGDDPATYIDGMRQILQKIRDIHAQPLFISSSPVNDGSLMGAWTSDRCRRLHPYTEALQKLAAEEKVPFVDQYHPLLELWGKNEQGQKIPLGGNPVHPGPVGQYTMAATILAGLKAEGDVSAATIRRGGTLVAFTGCRISDIAAKDGTLSFTRIDDAGPWPIDPACRSALDLLPQMANLSRCQLTVPDLPDGRYRVSINGKPAAVLTSQDLAAGWNMTTAPEGVIPERATAILGLIRTLESGLNNEWRAASKAKDETKLAAAQKAIDDCEAQIREACKPVSLRFEIAPEKP